MGSFARVCFVLIALSACGRAESDNNVQDASGGANSQGGRDTVSSGGSAITAGGTSAAGGATTSAGGAAATSVTPCNATFRAPSELCIGKTCPIQAVAEISCKRGASAPTLALDAESGQLAFSTYPNPSSNVTSFVVADWRDGAVTFPPVVAADYGKVFSTDDGYRYIAWLDKKAYRATPDGQLGVAIPVPETATQLDAKLDADGTAHVLGYQAPSLDVYSSDGTSTHVGDQYIQLAQLAPTPGLGVLFAEQGPIVSSDDGTFRISSWQPGEEARVVALVEHEAQLGMFKATEGTSALTVDTLGQASSSTSPGLPPMQRLLFLGEAGEPEYVFEANAKSSNCNGAYTAYAPDICKSTSRTEMLGESSVRGAHALARTSDGRLWVALLSGSVEATCRWLTVSACFETLPCSCREQSINSYAFTLSLYDASDLLRPRMTAKLRSSSEASIVMKSRGSELFLAVGTPLSNSAVLTWLAVETNAL